MNEEDWRYSTDTGWNEWDVQIYGNFWWSVVLQTVTEYHGGSKCLTRARLRYRLVATTVIINLAALSLLVYRQLNVGHVEPLLIGVYCFFLIFLSVRARRLKHRVAELIDLAAYRAGLQRILRKVSSEESSVRTAPKIEVG